MKAQPLKQAPGRWGNAHQIQDHHLPQTKESCNSMRVLQSNVTASTQVMSVASLIDPGHRYPLG